VHKVRDCDPWARRFDELDQDGSGILDKADILGMVESGVKITTKGLLSTKDAGLPQSTKSYRSYKASSRRSKVVPIDTDHDVEQPPALKKVEAGPNEAQIFDVFSDIKCQDYVSS
jgi:hypothetical protein